MTSVAIVIVILLALVVFGFWLMRWRFKRAVRQVMNAFISSGAIGPDKALNMEELGLGRRGWSIVRDYRGYALQGLMANKSVEQLEDGRLYLTKEAYEKYIRLTGMAPPDGRFYY